MERAGQARTKPGFRAEFGAALGSAAAGALVGRHCLVGRGAAAREK